MLKDVRHTSVVRGVSLESDREDIIRIVSRNVQVFCPGLVMLEFERRQLQLGDLFDAFESEAMELLADTGEARQIRDGSVSSAPGARR
jgi:hypothetical protein